MHHVRSTARAGKALVAALALALPARASAQIVATGTLNQQGGGLGNQLTVLTLQSPGNTSTASGCSLSTACPFTAVGVQNQTQAQSLNQTALAGLTGENVRIVGNFSEPQNANAAITLNDLRLFLYLGSGSTATALFQSQGLQPPNQSLIDQPGVGNFGFVFGLAGTDVSAFNAALAGRNLATVSIGVGASLSNAEGGLDTFSIARGPGGGGGGGGGGSVVPEPSTYVLLASGLLGLAGVARRRQRAS